MEVNNVAQAVSTQQFNHTQSTTNETKSQEVRKEGEVAKTPTENMERLQEEMSKEEQSENLKNLVEEMNRRMDPLNLSVKFGFNDDIEALYVSVLEKDTDRVIRQFPSEEAIELMKKMDEIVGMIFDEKG